MFSDIIAFSALIYPPPLSYTLMHQTKYFLSTRVLTAIKYL